MLPTLHSPLAQAEVTPRGRQPREAGQGVDGPCALRGHANSRPSWGVTSPPPGSPPGCSHSHRALLSLSPPSGMGPSLLPSFRQKEWRGLGPEKGPDLWEPPQGPEPPLLPCGTVPPWTISRSRAMASLWPLPLLTPDANDSPKLPTGPAPVPPSLPSSILSLQGSHLHVPALPTLILSPQLRPGPCCPAHQRPCSV